MKQHSELLGVESAEMWNPAFDWSNYFRECWGFSLHAFVLVQIMAWKNVSFLFLMSRLWLKTYYEKLKSASPENMITGINSFMWDFTGLIITET